MLYTCAEAQVATNKKGIRISFLKFMVFTR